jgi:hypothetical protein
MLPGITQEQYKGLLLSVGSHRGARPLSPIEVAKAFDAAKRAGATSDTIAAAMHLEGTTMISRFVRLLSLPEDVQLAVDWGRTGATIAFTGAAELARLPNESEQGAAGKAALEYQLSSSELKSLVQIRLRSHKPLGECVQEVVNLRPSVTIKHVFIGAVKGEPLKASLNKLTQLERDQLISRVASRMWPEAKNAAFRLGASRFTISVDDQFAKSVFRDADSLEHALSKQLQDEIGAVD